MRARPTLIATLFLMLSSLLHAQPSDQVNLGNTLAVLNGPWKFHLGDDPRYADPTFDDSTWETVDLTPATEAFDPISGVPGYVPGWTAKGHPGYWGYAWYRIRVDITTAPGQRLALQGPQLVDDAYQVFTNGTLLGSFGKFSPHRESPVIYNAQPVMFSLPRGKSTQVLAFRIWMDPLTLTYQPDAGGMHSAPVFGEIAAVAAHYDLSWLNLIRSYMADPIEACLFFLLMVMAASVVLFDRSDRAYLWLASIFFLNLFESANDFFAGLSQIESSLVLSILDDVVLRPLILGAWVMLWWVWFRLERPVWVPRVIAVLTLISSISTGIAEHLFLRNLPPALSAASHAVSIATRLLLLFILAAIVIRGVRKQGWEGWLAVPAVLLVGISQYYTELSVLHVRTTWFPFGIFISFGILANLVLVAVMFSLLIRRLLISVQRQRELALDVQHAQEVQQVILPVARTRYAGLTIESEYRPAREVGGDFFQIIPHPTDGSVLIVAGDVAGKGLQAGMLVALLVGGIRSTAEWNPDPLLVLQALNRRLIGRGSAVATCQALRISANGDATLANAGHLPPFRNGIEIPIEGSLPLGILPEPDYPILDFHLDPGDTLMLLSDGVSEAQDKDGHLFGFDRVAALMRARMNAHAIASAAQDFGQSDDISVVSILRTA